MINEKRPSGWKEPQCDISWHMELLEHNVSVQVVLWCWCLHIDKHLTLALSANTLLAIRIAQLSRLRKCCLDLNNNNNNGLVVTMISSGLWDKKIATLDATTLQVGGSVMIQQATNYNCTDQHRVPHGFAQDTVSASSLLEMRTVGAFDHLTVIGQPEAISMILPPCPTLMPAPQNCSLIPWHLTHPLQPPPDTFLCPWYSALGVRDLIIEAGCMQPCRCASGRGGVVETWENIG